MINGSYQSCQNTLRFTNPTTLQLFSDDPILGDQYDDFPEACIDNNERIQQGIDKRNNEVSQSLLSVTPIPVVDILTVKNLLEGDRVFLYDILGNIVFEEIVVGPELKLNLLKFTPGVYFIFVKNRLPVKIIKTF